MDIITALLAAIDLARDKRFEQAEAMLRTILVAEPAQPSALFVLGQCLLATGRAAEATEPLAHHLQLRPGHNPGRIALARAQLIAGLPEDALDTLAPLPDAAHTLRGTALAALGRAAEAVDAFTLALEADPADAEAALNLGNAHADLGAPELAERCIRQAIALQPGLAEAHASLGHLLGETGRVREAVAAAEAAIALRPDFALAHWNAGVALLLGGEWKAGWERYEWRKRHFADSFNRPATPEWAGEPLHGRTILVLAEQGMGDTIQFSRYLPLLVAKGARAAVECADSLATLLSGIPGIATHPRGAMPAHDCWVDQMSLPRLFGTTPETVPLPAMLTQSGGGWDRALPAGLRVGLVWAGNPLHSNDHRRSIDPAVLAPILGTPGCTFVSLQTGPQAGALAGVLDLSAQLADWQATAALLGALDLVVSVDTAVAHLAGTLGVPTWLMLPHAPDWRWMLGRDDTPWYSAMRLFRQDRPGDWTCVVQRVANALSASLAGGYVMAMPPFTCSVAPVTHAASSDAR